MSAIGSVGSSNVAFTQAVSQLNKVVANAIVEQADFAKKVVALNIGQSVEDNKAALAQARLDQVV